MTPRAAVATTAATGFLTAALVTLLLGIPVPQIHDEAAYLLQANTFANGRLTTATHPLWRHFETFYVLQRPTYQARYQPGQAAVLALGDIVGLPIIGAWIAAALACGAVTWMLLAWMPVPWSIAGGMIVALHPTALAWAHSYWGGALAVAAGALVVGGARRLIDAQSISSSMALGAGVVLLANTRPFEGAVLCVALIAIGFRSITLRALAPAIVVVVAGLAFNLYYDHDVTGSAFRLPYLEYGQQYEATPPLVWQRLREAPAEPGDMRTVATDWALPSYREGYFAAIPRKSALFFNAAFDPIPDAMLVRVADPTVGMALAIIGLALAFALLLPLMHLLRAWRIVPHLRAAAFALAVVFVLALMPVVMPLAHYAAPVVPIAILIWLASLREMRARRAFIAFASVVMMASIVMTLRESPIRWGEVDERRAIERSVEQQTGNHVVLVRYAPGHQDHFSWIQNLANIDAQRVVWARDLADNSNLMRYYAQRTIWRVTAGPRRPQLVLVARPSQQTGAESPAAPRGGPTN